MNGSRTVELPKIELQPGDVRELPDGTVGYSLRVLSAVADAGEVVLDRLVGRGVTVSLAEDETTLQASGPGAQKTAATRAEILANQNAIRVALLRRARRASNKNARAGQ